jgi:hypothetical protein
MAYEGVSLETTCGDCRTVFLTDINESEPDKMKVGTVERDLILTCPSCGKVTITQIGFDLRRIG